MVEDCWVSRMRLEKDKWQLWKNDEELGQFDVVVIAHNGARRSSPAREPAHAHDYPVTMAPLNPRSQRPRSY